MRPERFAARVRVDYDTMRAAMAGDPVAVSRVLALASVSSDPVVIGAQRAAYTAHVDAILRRSTRRVRSTS